MIMISNTVIIGYNFRLQQSLDDESSVKHRAQFGKAL